MSDIIDRVLGAARKRLETEDGLTGEKLDEAVEVFKDELAQQLTKPREVQAPVSRENLRTAYEINDESMLELAAESGASECFSYDNFHEVHTANTEIYEVKNKLEKKN